MIAALLLLLGVTLVVVGASLVSVPAGLVVAGLSLSAVALFHDFEGGDRG